MTKQEFMKRWDQMRKTKVLDEECLRIAEHMLRHPANYFMVTEYNIELDEDSFNEDFGEEENENI